MSRLFRVTAVLLLLTGAACSRNDFAPAGGEDYGTVMAIGESYTAGFMNSALSRAGQDAGFANLVSRQVNGRDLESPLVAMPGLSNSTVTDAQNNVRFLGQLFVTPQGGLSQTPYPVGFDPTALLLNARALAPYENLGVPFAFTADPVTAVDAATSFLAVATGGQRQNSFFDLILRNSLLPGQRTQMQQALDVARSGFGQPRVLVLWVGSIDILLGATEGSPIGLIPPTAAFEQALGGVVASTRALGFPEVVLGNIPSITSLPYFTAIPPSPATGVRWNMEESDAVLVLLPARPLLFLPTGVANPEYLPGGGSTLPARYTLSLAEFSHIQQMTAEYNGVLATTASTELWALADVNAGLAALPNDPRVPANLATLNAAFPLLPGPTGPVKNVLSAFSLDGVHPSERGYARIANLFLGALNDHYGSDYPPVDEAAVDNVNGWELFGTSPVVDTRPLGGGS